MHGPDPEENVSEVVSYSFNDGAVKAGLYLQERKDAFKLKVETDCQSQDCDFEHIARCLTDSLVKKAAVSRLYPSVKGGKKLVLVNYSNSDRMREAIGKEIFSYKKYATDELRDPHPHGGYWARISRERATPRMKEAFGTLVENQGKENPGGFYWEGSY